MQFSSQQYPPAARDWKLEISNKDSFSAISHSLNKQLVFREIRIRLNSTQYTMPSRLQSSLCPSLFFVLCSLFSSIIATFHLPVWMVLNIDKNLWDDGEWWVVITLFAIIVYLVGGERERERERERESSSCITMWGCEVRGQKIAGTPRGVWGLPYPRQSQPQGPCILPVPHWRPHHTPAWSVCHLQH